MILRVFSLNGWTRTTLCLAGAWTCLAALSAAAAPAPSEVLPLPPADGIIHVDTKTSLIHLKSLDSFDVTEGGKGAAKFLLDAIDNKNMDAAREAIATYDKIIPDENFGGEYTSLRWIAQYLQASDEAKKKMVADPFVASWYEVLSKDNFAVVKKYMKKKYHIENLPTEAGDDRALRFTEDFLLFNNPVRENWEKSSKILDCLRIKKGDKIADFGSGPGYYSFKFTDLVGPTGKVYALENNPDHLRYLVKYSHAQNITNFEVVSSGVKGPDMKDKVDMVFMCSLYHIFYIVFPEPDRDKIVGTIKDMMKPDGRFVVVDNTPVEDKRKLPYHGPYIARELLINQLRHYGFVLTEHYQFTPQRYVLIFKLAPEGSVPVLATTKPLPPNSFWVTNKTSIIRSPRGGPSTGFSDDGRKAAGMLLKAVGSKDPEALKATLALYNEIIPKERFGDEYTAFTWVINYLLTPEADRPKLLSDPVTAEYFDFIGKDDFALLKKYLRNKYFLNYEKLPSEDIEIGNGKKLTVPLDPSEMELADKELSMNQIDDWCDFIAFNNPNRESWEKTSKVLEFLKIKPGDAVADLGSGPGFYTFKFSTMVGDAGKVFPVELNTDYLEYIMKVGKKHGFKNIVPVAARMNDTRLAPESCDLIYICSMYHAVYLTDYEFVKDQFAASVKQALKKHGRLVIAENEIMKPDEVAYYGPGVVRELEILQLKHYGFKLVDTAQFIPQRYILVFEKQD